MLVLTRRRDESIHIGEDVIVTVLEIRRDSVRLGIAAPQTTEVHREEIYLKLKRDREAGCGGEELPVA